MSTPTTTLVPFDSLPSCAADCGPLYDANGACVPPTAEESSETVYSQCFCSYSSLQGLFDDPPSDVCNAECESDEEGYTSIRDWFTSLCSEVATATADSDSSSSTSSSSSGDGGGDWLSGHWKWVVMLVIMFVGIVGIWIGACLWRRHYLKKKDRVYELGKHNAAAMRASGAGQWGPGSGVNVVQYGDGAHPAAPRPRPTRAVPNGNANGKRSSTAASAAAVPPVPSAAAMSPAVLEEKTQEDEAMGKGKEKEKEKNKWVVEERT